MLYLEQTLPCIAQKSGFMSGSVLDSSGNSIFRAEHADSSVAQQFTIICSCTSLPQDTLQENQFCPKVYCVTHAIPICLASAIVL